MDDNGEASPRNLQSGWELPSDLTLRGGSNMLMECSECGSIQDARIHQKKYRGILHAYIECDTCYVRTTSFVTDSATRKHIEELNTLKYEDRDEVRQKKLDKMITRNMEKLKKRYQY